MEDLNFGEFNFEEQYQKIKKKIKKPNILVCGGTGVGKSSIINFIFESELAQVSSGKPVTRGIKKYESDKSSVILYDSEGYEIGDEKLDDFKNKILGFIDEKRLKPLNEQIHLVWYCISAANKRIPDIDLELINQIQSKNINICIVLTQIDSVSIDEYNELINTINTYTKNLDFFKTSIYVDDFDNDFLDWNNLIEWSLKNLNDSLQEGFIRELQYNLDKKKDFINKKIIPLYTTSAAAIAATPIPMSDSALLIPLQCTMSIHILHLWGLDRYEGVLNAVINSTILSQSGKFIAKTLTSNLIKLIPGVGTVLGGCINATVATTFTSALGYALSELSYRYVEELKNGKNTYILDIFTNKDIVKLIEYYFKNNNFKI